MINIDNAIYIIYTRQPATRDPGLGLCKDTANLQKLSFAAAVLGLLY